MKDGRRRQTACYGKIGKCSGKSYRSVGQFPHRPSAFVCLYHLSRAVQKWPEACAVADMDGLRIQGINYSQPPKVRNASYMVLEPSMGSADRLRVEPRLKISPRDGGVFPRLASPLSLSRLCQPLKAKVCANQPQPGQSEFGLGGLAPMREGLPAYHFFSLSASAKAEQLSPAPTDTTLGLWCHLIPIVSCLEGSHSIGPRPGIINSNLLHIEVY
jgi:hypothetical protein